MTFNAERFQRLLDAVIRERDNPEPNRRFDMGTYGYIDTNPGAGAFCGTACCAMGLGLLTGIFDGVTPVYQPNWREEFNLHPLSNSGIMDWEDLGEEQLGLSHDEYYHLFVGGRSLDAQIGVMQKFLVKKTAPVVIPERQKELTRYVAGCTFGQGLG
jgi:hypothetical protein